MFIVGRTATINVYRAQAAMEWCVGITDYVNSTTGSNFAVYTALSGAPAGSVGWSGRVDSMSAADELNATLSADPEYLERLGQAEGLVGGPMDLTMHSVVSTTLDGPKGFAMMQSARIANGQLATATAWGQEIAEYYTGLTGLGVTFMSTAFGEMGRLTWAAASDDIADLEAGREKSVNDPGYLERLDAAGPLFIEGSGNAMLVKRLG